MGTFTSMLGGLVLIGFCAVGVLWFITNVHIKGDQNKENDQ